jgi:hypothetical protein
MTMNVIKVTISTYGDSEEAYLFVNSQQLMVDFIADKKEVTDERKYPECKSRGTVGIGIGTSDSYNGSDGEGRCADNL